MTQTTPHDEAVQKVMEAILADHPHLRKVRDRMIRDGESLTLSSEEFFAEFRKGLEVAAQNEQTPEYGWLVEMTGKNGEPHWLDLSDSDFTKDSLKATRFCRKQDAEVMIRHLGLSGLFATEHQWG